MAKYSDEADDPTALTHFGARRCTAVNRHGERCGKPASRHLEVCSTHGARFQNNVDQQRKFQTEADARKVLAKSLKGWEQNPEAIANPIQAMAELAGRDQYLLDRIWSRLEPKLQDCECCGAELAQMDGGALVAYTMASKGLRASLTEMAKMGIHERMVDIEEQKVTMVVLALVTAIQDVLPDLNSVQHGNIKSAFLKKLAELASNAPEPQVVLVR